MVLTSFLSKSIPDGLRMGYFPPWYLESPTSSTDLPAVFLPFPATLHKVWAETDTGTIDINMEIRPFGSAGSSGTDTMASDLQVTSSGVTQDSFSVSEIDEENWLTLVASAAASSPTKLWCCFAFVWARG